MAERRSLGRNGLVMKAWAPPDRAFTQDTESACAVKTKTGNCSSEAIPPHPREDTPPVENGEADVEDHEVRHLSPYCRKAGATIGLPCELGDSLARGSDETPHHRPSLRRPGSEGSPTSAPLDRSHIRRWTGE